MPGAILQLQATGIQDQYLLSPNIQDSFFEYGYHRYLNFATEIVKITTNENMNWGKRTHAVIPRAGHLLSSLYLKLKLPPLTITSGDWAGWSDTLGYSILSHLHLEIGGVIVERLEPQYLDMKFELENGTANHGRNNMILKSDTYVATQFNAVDPQSLYVHLPFFFTKQYNLALPISSITSQDIRVYLGFKSFDECIHYDGATPPNYVDVTDVELWGEYIFLDNTVLEQFEQREHNFVVDSVQYNGIHSVPASLTSSSSRLEFNHPVKELLFALVDQNSIDNNDHFNYNRYADQEPLLLACNLYLENVPRYENDLSEDYLRSVFAFKQHSFVPNKRIYCIPFSLNPESNQPSGALNFSRFSNINLQLFLNSGNPQVFLYTFAIYHNFITIANGSFYMQFQV